jgi:hypothetical protein
LDIQFNHWYPPIQFLFDNTETLHKQALLPSVPQANRFRWSKNCPDNPHKVMLHQPNNAKKLRCYSHLLEEKLGKFHLDLNLLADYYYQKESILFFGIFTSLFPPD